ncbi:SMP-30/gluconolactonase/LRE family protein [Luteolibacter pohnpeiensis]|uniref:SMP-30/gluconolactonase/LRE family protein n=2 Tax=Luteolibacter pohnpeiensis TaxID=454153 RepID=A0A934VUA0_9BACT|nr:SMP-30/gluconolactonase/LRE family protein [Luteolibacter pohnpeiensis]
MMAAAQEDPTIERIDPALDQLVPKDAAIEVLATGFKWAEGPVWDEKSGELLFSDIPNNVIHAWNPETGLRDFMKPSGYTGIADYGREPGSNGLTFDAAGRLLCAEHGDRRISALTPNGGKITLADRFEGKRLNSPNDLVVHPSGAIYFTDPVYGLPGQADDPHRELDFCGVFRIDPDDGAVSLISKEFNRPNGIALSSDGKTLFVGSSDGSDPRIYAYPIREEGGVGERRVFFDMSKIEKGGGADGFKVDADGNVWTTGSGGLLIISAEGKLLGRVWAHRPTANIAFGGADGKSVFITAGDRLLRFPRL